MRVKHKSRDIEYHYFKISFLIIIILTVLFGIIPTIASANPVPVYYIGWDVGGNILLLFFSNLIIDSLILLIPLFILYEMGYEKKISELWIFGVPLLAIWGAYIDAIYIKINLIIEKNSILAGLGVFIICLFFIVLTFIAVIHFILGHQLKSGIIIGTIAGIINAVFWSLLNFRTIYNYPVVQPILVFSGLMAFFFLILLMLGFFIRRIKQKQYYEAIHGSSPNVDNSMIKASGSIVHTFFLLFLAFLMMLYLG